jgi:hypothetical protein
MKAFFPAIDIFFRFLKTIGRFHAYAVSPIFRGIHTFLQPSDLINSMLF